MREIGQRVTGRLAFTEDMPLAGLTYAKLVLSYFASATILKVHVDSATGMPGVLAVITGDHCEVGGDSTKGLLAYGQVSYVGQPVAVVIGATPATAADGAAVVEVDYEPLPAVLDPKQAIGDNAPRVLLETSSDVEDASAHGAATAEMRAGQRRVGNVSGGIDMQRGDVTTAMAGCAEVIHNNFSIARVHHGFLEPHVVTAAIERDGSITVWSPTQGMTLARRAVAQSLRIDESRVRVVPMPIGGGFGGKIVQFEPLVAHLARLVGRPVRLLLTRTEEFLLGFPAPAAEIGLELGATSDGLLVAMQADVDYDNGATAGWHSGITAELIVSTYRVPHFHVRSREIATNKLPVTSYRGPGAPQAYFALESCIDELARKVGVDPIDLRLRNASREGDSRGDGSPWPRIGLLDCLEAAKRHPAYTDGRRAGEGVGVAAGGWIGGFGPAAAACFVEADGAFALHLGSIDISGTDVGFAILAAEEFGTSPERVRIRRTDTFTSPVSPIAAGSATTYSLGPAVMRAVVEVRRQVLELAANNLEAAVDDLELVDGLVRVKGAPLRSISVREVSNFAGLPGGPGPIHAIGRASVGGPAPMFCVHIARVEVDRDTGGILVSRYAAIHDVGYALNRSGVVGQIHGGVLQGLGRALGEEITYDSSGQLRTASFIDYALPTVEMAPTIEVQLLEVPSEYGSHGARGVGEPPVIPVLAAVANAIRDATGIRLARAPFSQELLAGLIRGT